MGADDANQERRAAGASDDEHLLHARLLQRDPTAPSDLAIQYLEPLNDWLRQAHPRHDDALLITVAIELILSVGERPAQYDPSRLTLTSYLRMAARRDVLNAVDKERRRAAHHAPLEDVELLPPGRNSRWAGASDPLDAALDSLEIERLASMRGEFDDQEWEVVQLLIDGERRTDAFAAVLGIVDRPLPEQTREVKRAKDRVKKRIQRRWTPDVADGR